MTPLTLLLWVGVICASIVFVTLTIAIIVGAIQSLTKKKETKSVRIL